MTTECYAMVRGSAIRVTGLESHGQVPSPIRFATSKAVASVRVNEIIEAGSNELISGEDDEEKRLHFVRPEQTIRHTVDIDFLRVDPGVLHLVAGVPLIYQFGVVGSYGFGEMSFGEAPFGEGSPGASLGDVIGFDSDTRRPVASFALEVWSRLSGAACADGVPRYGYTVFPFLKGGYLTGFEFRNGLVSFNLRGAQTRKDPKWGVGPFDLEGTNERLIEPVSRNTMYRQMVTTAAPPVEVCGIQETTDVIDGGTATMTTADIVDGEFVDTSVWIVEGGRAV